MRFNAIPSCAGGASRLAYARLCEAGSNPEPLLSKAELTRDLIDNPEARIKVRSQISFLKLVADALQDDLLGFHLAQTFDLREIGLLYYVMASSDTLADALQRADRYGSIVNDGMSLRVSRAGEISIVLKYVAIERTSDRHQIEFYLTSLVRLCRQLTGRELRPARIRLMHRRSEEFPELTRFLGSEIEFGSNLDELVFEESARLLQVVSADPHLDRLLTRYSDEAIAHRPTGQSRLRPSLENVIVPLLPHGKARANEIARRLGMSHRTLVRRLSSEGLTFSRILDELRADLGKQYLSEDNLPISQIAWLLGYREVSAFTRATRRWTGSAPKQFRAQRQSAPPNDPDADAVLQSRRSKTQARSG